MLMGRGKNGVWLVADVGEDLVSEDEEVFGLRDAFAFIGWLASFAVFERLFGTNET